MQQKFITIQSLFLGVTLMFLLSSCNRYDSKSAGMACPTNAAGIKNEKREQNSGVSCPTAVGATELNTDRNNPKKPTGTCPPAAIGAEKLLAYLDKHDADKSKAPTKKTDPVSGKTTSKAKGIRTKELEKPPRLTKEQKAAKRREEKEQRIIARQYNKDMKEYLKEPVMY